MKVDWSHILFKLRDKLSEGVFKVWLEPLKGEVVQTSLSFAESGAQACKWEIRLVAPNGFWAAWIRDNLSQTIVQTAAEVLGAIPSLLVELDKSGRKDAGRPLFPAPLSPKDLAKTLPSAPAVLASTKQLILPVDMPRVDKPSRVVISSFKHSFEDFVIGPCNQLAHAAASNIMHAASQLDMLFLCSPSGLGKTHLTQAVGKALCNEADKAHFNIEYLTAEEFTSQFVQASKFGGMEQFKERFRQLDMLLLEDVHFLRGKDKTQEELLATINVLQSRGGRVVLTSSFAPREMSGVDSQLVSRFCSGFIVSIERPGKDTRLNILMEKARRQSVILPEHIAEMLADRVTSDIRMLESCLYNLMHKSRLLGRPMTEEMAAEIIGVVANNNCSLSLESVIEMICRSFHLTPSQLASRSRRQNLVDARNTAYYLLRKHTDLTLEEIGSRFNRRHSSVIKGITHIEREMSSQTAQGRQYQNTVRMIERNAVKA